MKTVSYSAPIVGAVVFLLALGVIALEFSSPTESSLKQSVARGSADGHWAEEALAQIRRCEGGDASACFEAGSSYDVGRGVPKDQGAAASYFVRACDLRFAGGCAGAAMLSGDKTEEARQFLKKACALDDKPSCNKLAHRSR